MPTLSDNAVKEQYVNECRAMSNNIERSTSRGLKAKLIKAVNSALDTSGIPKVGSSEDNKSDANAYFSFKTWSITFGRPLCGDCAMTYKMLIDCANTVYHESRHCEQWFRMAQGVASGPEYISNQDLFVRFQQDISRTAANINKRMGIETSAATAAVTNCKNIPVSKFDIQKWWRSIYAVRAKHRGEVLTHIQVRYNQYRELPEEVDAWRCGDDAGERLKEALNVRDNCPCYHDWKVLTARSGHFRSGHFQATSGTLVAVDQALLAFEQDRRSRDKREALVKAFSAWYSANKKERTMRDKANFGEQEGVITQLRTFLGLPA